METAKMASAGTLPDAPENESLRLAKAHDLNGLKALELCDEAAFDIQLADERAARARFEKRMYGISFALVVLGTLLMFVDGRFATLAFGLGFVLLMAKDELRRDRSRPILARCEAARQTYALAHAIRTEIDASTLAVASVTAGDRPAVPHGTFSDPEAEDSSSDPSS